MGSGLVQTHWMLTDCISVASLTLVTRRPYCPGRPKELCFTTLSLAMGTMGMMLSMVKQSFFGPPGQYGCLVTGVNCIISVQINWLKLRDFCWLMCYDVHLTISLFVVLWNLRINVKAVDNITGVLQGQSEFFILLFFFCGWQLHEGDSLAQL